MRAAQFLADLASRGIHVRREGDKLRVSASAESGLNDQTRDAIRNRRAELLHLLSAPDPGPLREPVGKAPEGAPVRCSIAQERFLFSALMEGSPEPYRLNAAFRFVGDLDVPALEASLRDVVSRHDALHSRFEQGEDGILMVASSWRPTLPLADFAGTEDELLSRTVEAQAPFDLMNGPHLGATLFRLAADRHILFLSVHHMVSDGESIALLLEEIQSHYAWRAGAGPAPAEPSLQLRDVAFGERRELAGERLASGVAFWKTELEGAPLVTALPLDHPRPPVRACSGGAVPIEIGAAVLDRLARVRARAGLSEFQLIASALALLLHLYSRHPSVVIGTPWRNRERAGTEKVIGPLLNLLPLHIRPGSCLTLADLLAETRSRTLAAMAWGTVPFQAVVNEVSQERSPSFTPVFQVMCAIEPTSRDVVRLPGLSIEPLDVADEAARYDLALVLRRSRGGLHGAMKYDRALFEEATARRLTGHFLAALDIVLGNPARRLADISLLSDKELGEMLVEWNDSQRDYPLDRTLIDLFEAAACRNPDRIAVEHERRTLTYRALDRRAEALAQRLRRLDVGVDDVVAISVERSLELVIGIIAVMKAGAAYVAVDRALPEDRRAFMIADADAKAVIGAKPGCSALPQVEVGADCSETEEDRSAGARARPDSASYIIYTSGSSGRPKGVVTDHRAIVNNLLWMNDEWPLTAADAVLFKSSPGFDVSVKEIFWPLIAGARLVVASPGVERDPEALRDIIERRRVTVVHLVPTMLDFFLRHGSPSDIGHLRIVMCGGEALTPALRTRFHRTFSAVLLHLYGPTEAAIAVTGYAISPEMGEAQRLPLGRPMPNCRIYVLDQEQRPVPVGVAGELCIAGVPLARGYLRSPGLTAEKFVPEPFSGQPGSRMYRTGDLCRMRGDGLIEYVGRIDRQIKLHGLRIEPGEIECAIRAHEGVDDALVVEQGSPENRSLAAYVVTQRPDFQMDRLRLAIREHLPPFMVPATFTAITALPLNANGKVDVAALPPTGAAAFLLEGSPPKGELEEKIARIWSELLDMEGIARDESFFELGGHSLLVIQLQAKIRDVLGDSVPLPDLFNNSTVADLASSIERTRKEGGSSWTMRMLTIGKSLLN